MNEFLDELDGKGLRDLIEGMGERGRAEGEIVGGAKERIVGILRRELESEGKREERKEGGEGEERIMKGEKEEGEEYDGIRELVVEEKGKELLSDGATVVIDADMIIKEAEREAMEEKSKLERETSMSSKSKDVETPNDSQSEGAKLGEDENNVIEKLEIIEEILSTKSSSDDKTEEEVLLGMVGAEDDKAKEGRKKWVDSIDIDECEMSASDVARVAFALTRIRKGGGEGLEVMVGWMRRLREDGMRSMSGSELSMMAYAIARGGGRKIYGKTTKERLEGEDVRTVLGWIAKWGLVRMGVAPEDVGVEHRRKSDGPDNLKPPFLARLMWALAFCSPGNPTDDLAALAQASIDVCGARLDNFTPEELGKVAWAYGKLGRINESPHISHTLATVGRIYAAIEVTLRRWEDWQYVGLILDVGEAQNLEERMERVAELGEECPIDPGVLSKATWSFVKLIHGLGGTMGGLGRDLVRVAAKVFTLREGELLKQLGTRDLVRMVWSCAMTDAGGGGIRGEGEGTKRRREVFDKLAHLAYEIVKEEESWGGMVPGDKANFAWALSELGVGRKGDGETDVLKWMNITKKEVEELDGALNSKLLSGLTTMGRFRGGEETDLLLNLLLGIESKIPSFNVKDIRRTVWSISKMRREASGAKGERVAGVCRDILTR